MAAYLIPLSLMLILLVAGYTFISHTLEKRRIQRQRLTIVLKARRNAFSDLAKGFPEGFLPQDLKVLLHKALVDCCEQLVRLEPKEPVHLEHLQTFKNLGATQTSYAHTQLESAEHIKEAKHLLQELHKFVLQQASLKLIMQPQTEIYVDQIKQVMVQISVDGHVVNARQAYNDGKIRLAIHHYSLGRKLLVTENSRQQFSKRIGQLDSVIHKLTEKAEFNETSPASQPASTTSDTPEGIKKQWNDFHPEDDSWKKKPLYD